MNIKAPECDCNTIQENEDRFTPYSSLYSIIECAEPRSVGYNSKTLKIQRDATKLELSSLECNADTALTSFSCGIAAIGVLMMNADTSEIPEDTWRHLGDLLTTLGESQVALNNLRMVAQESEPAPPATPTPSKKRVAKAA